MRGINPNRIAPLHMGSIHKLIKINRGFQSSPVIYSAKPVGTGKNCLNKLSKSVLEALELGKESIRTHNAAMREFTGYMADKHKVIWLSKAIEQIRTTLENPEAFNALLKNSELTNEFWELCCKFIQQAHELKFISKAQEEKLRHDLAKLLGDPKIGPNSKWERFKKILIPLVLGMLGYLGMKFIDKVSDQVFEQSESLKAVTHGVSKPIAQGFDKYANKIKDVSENKKTLTNQAQVIQSDQHVKLALAKKIEEEEMSAEAPKAKEAKASQSAGSSKFFANMYNISTPFGDGATLLDFDSQCANNMGSEYR
jgi:hypothetical protein